MYQGYAINLHTVDMASAVQIAGITNQGIQTGTTDLQEANAGEPFASHLSINAISPTETFTSYDVKKIFDEIGIIGKAITADPTHPGLQIYAVDVDPNGQVNPAAAHRIYTVENGLIFPSRLACDHQGELTADLQIAVRWDRTNDPIKISDGEALPTGAFGNVRWSLGKIDLNGTQLQLTKSVAVDFNNNLVQESGNSDHYPTDLKINSLLPRLGITCLDVQQFAAAGIPLVAKKLEHANTSIYFRKRIRGVAQYVADATPEHIKLTASGAAYWDSPHTASGNERAEGSITIPCDWDGTNDPLVIDTASAIT